MHHVYYLLAAFDLTTVLLSLSLGNEVRHVYARSVEVNQLWAVRLGEYARLVELAAAVNKPGNDVFYSGAIELESERMEIAALRFEHKLNELREVRTSGHDASRSAGGQQINDARVAMDQMVHEARAVFGWLRLGRSDQAVKHMATMDRDHATVSTILRTLDARARGYQSHNLAAQMASLAPLRRLETAIALLVLMMVGGVTVYGRRLARRVKQASLDLAAHRERLEEALAERTRDLQTTNARLRLTERLASIGTLVAGLSHDMNNVLFPTRCRLDVLATRPLSATARDDVLEVRRSIDFLQSLSDDLCRVARRPEGLDAHGPASFCEGLRLHAWWADVRSLLVTALPADARLKVDLPPSLKPVAIAPQNLTQAVFNLVLNAGEALAGAGTIVVRAYADPDGDARVVRIEVSDDGVGMSAEVQRQALDAFFTTKTRSLSTGMGLAIVHSNVHAAGGAVEIESEPGQGTTIRLDLPIAQAQPREEGMPLGSATVSLRDRRIATLISSMLRSHGLEVRYSNDDVPGDCAIWVADGSDSLAAAADSFLAASAARRLIVVGAEGDVPSRPGITVIEPPLTIESLQRAILAAAAER